MTRDQAFALLVLGVLVIMAGFAWMYGPPVLFASGSVLVVLALVVGLRE